MLIQSLRPSKFSEVVGNSLNNKILMALAHNTDNAPSTLLLQGHFGSGKAIDMDSLLPTPSGNKKASEIQVGDFLFDRHGNPTQVLGVYLQGELDSYKVRFEDGRVVYCNSEHLWSIVNRKTNSLETKSLLEIIESDYKQHPVYIPVNDPVQYETAELPIDPYILGLLLSNAVYNACTILYPNTESKYIDFIFNAFPDYKWEIYTDGKYRFPIKDGVPTTPEIFFGDLYQDIVVRKTIPDLYLYAGVEQRWELLRGIMDSCATVSYDNNVYCYPPVNYNKIDLLNVYPYVQSFNLIITTRQLAFSLGLIVSRPEHEILFFKTNRSLILYNLFKNKYRINRPFNHFYDIYSMQIVSIEKEEKKRSMVCFTVANEEGLYLCNDYVVTHNTTSARLFAKALNCKNLKENDICGKCENCKADLNTVPWYNEFDSSMLGVEDIREMRDILLTTSRGYNKVIVLDECHLLNAKSLSALLKVFEESPKGVFYLLATTDPEKVLPTIRSRSLELVFTTKTMDEVKKDITKHANDLGISISESTISFIASRSKGIMRNAHMLLDKVRLLGEQEFLNSDISSTQPLYNYVVSLIKADKQSVLESVSELSRLPVTYLKEDYQQFFLTLIKASIDPSTTTDTNILKLVKALPKPNIISLVKTCTQDWVIRSFQSSTQAQAALLSIFQMISKA